MNPDLSERGGRMIAKTIKPLHAASHYRVWIATDDNALRVDLWHQLTPTW
jgi:hypothetical protein